MPKESRGIMKNEAAGSDLRMIPGVGKAMEQDFFLLGIRSVSGLKGKNPEELYERLCALTGEKHDRCVLYVFRAAVGFAEAPPEERASDRFKWWSFKD